MRPPLLNSCSGQPLCGVCLISRGLASGGANMHHQPVRRRSLLPTH